MVWPCKWQMSSWEWSIDALQRSGSTLQRRIFSFSLRMRRLFASILFADFWLMYRVVGRPPPGRAEPCPWRAGRARDEGQVDPPQGGQETLGGQDSMLSITCRASLRGLFLSTCNISKATDRPCTASCSGAEVCTFDKIDIFL